MAIITREEVIKIARMSNITVHEQEIEPLIQQLQAILNYAERVQEVAAVHAEGSIQAQVNVMREDNNVPFDANAILVQAPEREDRFFVVPKILENS